MSRLVGGWLKRQPKTHARRVTRGRLKPAMCSINARRHYATTDLPSLVTCGTCRKLMGLAEL